MITDTISHDEAIIRHFMEDTEFADLYLHTVKDDGDEDEIAEVQAWYDEAKSRKYWDDIVANAELTAKNGYSIKTTVVLVSRALDILKSALPVEA